ncbi:uncharacterized protein L969DRAFT_253030 [Mixia osmundae IAM 14324]|uniref:Lysophospholipase n=1 Tax=Mixia osmundae (strain CBS 9802 / IAM 14324 / JCM 22182 / KY 12970) TaxID=764103 RepID=G7E1U6_MIXOS|nr:uncharacterized protein L969DRAFT_253030 [Mixia osmundae IAM 14324]KEI36752.1 hypothetical protein L969DRAFT_253030 [Mixia osmundae IAM 14324]GAA96806.1 hypothetical protein E5Q_03478 [Mixia osmundae IAM 14324]
MTTLMRQHRPVRALVRPHLLVGSLLGASVGVYAGSSTRRTLWSKNADIKCDAVEPSKSKNVFSLDKLKEAFQLPDVPEQLKDWGQSWKELRQGYDSIVSELSRAKGSLYRDIVDKHSEDLVSNPEIDWQAHVRLDGEDRPPALPHAERAYLRNRREKARLAFARLIDVPVDEIDALDVPIIGIAGSGGGYRAMVNTIGSLRGAKASGILDCTTYLAGISGSCWALTLYYSLGKGDIEHLISHVRSRITTSFFDKTTFDLLTNPPTNSYLLSGAILKEASEAGEFSLVDAYGTLVASRLYIPDHIDKLDNKHLKLSNQRQYIDDGDYPLPIYSAIRHSIPQFDTVIELNKQQIRKLASRDKDKVETAESLEKQKRELLSRASYQWFEMTPYEIGCEELGAWIPTWSFGRRFENGKSIDRKPELSTTIFAGIWASAFCASLANYYREVSPLLKVLPYYSRINEIVSAYNDDLSALHPFPPANIPSYLKGIDGLRAGSEDLTQTDTLGFLDAGAVCNLPYEPLFRRNCDLIIALDASADSQEVWFQRASDYAKKRGMAGWPKVDYRPPATFAKKQAEVNQGDSKDVKPNQTKEPKSEDKVGEAKDQADHQKAGTTDQPTGASDAGSAPEDGPMPEVSSDSEPPIGRFNCWVGDSQNTGDKSARLDEPTVEEVRDRDGVALVYYPLLPGKKLDNVAEVWSTWKFDYTPEQTDQLLDLAQSNFETGDKKLKIILKGLYERKRARRLQQQDA